MALPGDSYSLSTAPRLDLRCIRRAARSLIFTTPADTRSKALGNELGKGGGNRDVPKVSGLVWLAKRQGALIMQSEGVPTGEYLQWLFASTTGRLRRSTYWYASLSLVVLTVVLVLIAGAFGDHGHKGMQALIMIPALLVYIVGGLSLAVKRLHDRDMSGGWVLAGFIPYLGALFMFIVAGCMRGTIGRNEYGPDPVASDTVDNLPGNNQDGVTIDTIRSSGTSHSASQFGPTSVK